MGWDVNGPYKWPYKYIFLEYQIKPMSKIREWTAMGGWTAFWKSDLSAKIKMEPTNRVQTWTRLFAFHIHFNTFWMGRLHPLLVG